MKERRGRLSFLLAAGGPRAAFIDFEKLCTHIEPIPRFGPEQVTALVAAVRDRCLSAAFPHIPTTAADNPWSSAASYTARMYGLNHLSTAVADLLCTPRALKHALRRAWAAWATLYGEVEFDHLLAVSVLRHGAPEAFSFLLRNRDQLTEHPSRDPLMTVERRDDGRERFRAEWDEVTAGVDWRVPAAESVLIFLFPAAAYWLRNALARGMTGPLQGVGSERHWLRIVNESIADTDVRDQQVLRDCVEWSNRCDSSMPMIDGIAGGGDYCRAWRQLGQRVLGTDSTVILRLAAQVKDRIREGYVPESAWDNLNTPFLTVTLYAREYVRRSEEATAWLEHQVRLAMPVNLPLVNHLYYWWGSYHSGVVTEDERNRIRGLIHELSRDHFRTAADWIGANRLGYRNSLNQLVSPSDINENPSVLVGPDHWRWLAPVLLDAMRQGSRATAVQIAYLISEHHRQFGTSVYTITADCQRLTSFFGQAATEVVALLRTEAGRASGEDRAVLEAVAGSAERCLSAIRV